MPRILLVDPHRNACNELAGVLRSAGYEVDCAHNGVNAINQFNTLGADAVVLDVLMPDSDGWRVLKWIRSRADRDEVPVIIHSRLNDSTWSVAEALGANDRWDRGACNCNDILRSLQHFAHPRACVAA